MYFSAALMVSVLSLAACHVLGLHPAYCHMVGFGSGVIANELMVLGGKK